jgi:glutamate carboxypeptidase
MTSGLVAWCRAEHDWLLETIAALVRLESPSTDKAAVDRCGAELAARLAGCGATVSRVANADRGDHVLAEVAGDGAPLLLLGHFDTVWPVGQLSRMPFAHDRATGRLHGPGVFDMKAGIAVAMLALRALRTGPDEVPRVRMLWTTDEEICSDTSLPGGGAKTSRKGVGEFELVVHGISAHAGLDPGKGASAIHELAHQILAIEALQDPVQGITLNVGVVEGGSRTNVVADRARAAIDVRVPTLAAAEALTARMAALRPRSGRTRLEVRGGISRPPLERTAAVAALFHTAQSVARELGVDLPEGSAGGGSDGNFTGAIGVPTLDGLGPRGDGAHALHEHVVVEDLPWRAAFLAALIRRVSGTRVVQ